MGVVQTQQFYLSDEGPEVDRVIYGAFQERVISEYAHTAHGYVGRSRRIPTLNGLVPESAELLRSHRYNSESTLNLYSGDGYLLIVEYSSGTCSVDVASQSSATAHSVVDQIIGKIPADPPVEETRVQFGLWTQTRSGPRLSCRDIECDTWADSARNYPTGVREPLADLMAMRKAPKGQGKLILWHGVPGTGKTTAIRTMAREWKSWAEPHYITDPEQMFGDPSYLMEVTGDSTRSGKWQLLIAEDTDQFLRTDAQKEAGAGALGRLLNFTDGILGQGARTLILLTTNEELGQLHPAIIRPGRCLTQLEFERFTPAEATEWLGSPLEKAQTLAELIEARSRTLVAA